MLYYDRQIDDVRIAVWHVTEEYEELLGILPDSDIVRYQAEQQFRSKSRIIEWTTVRVLLYTILGRQIQIQYNEQGAPMLPDYEGLHIGISHTKGYVAIVLSEMFLVGIDVEQIEPLDNNTDEGGQRIPRVVRVKKHFIRNDEFVESVVGILLCWSAKESVYKVLGREGVNFLEELKIHPFDEKTYEGEFELEDLKEENIYLIKYKVFDDFVLTFTLKNE